MSQVNHQHQPQQEPKPASASSEAWSTRLMELERAGDLIGCYGLFRRLTKSEAMDVALAAGHFLRSPNARDFWDHLQSQVARACELRCDGWAMRHDARDVAKP